jgi:Arc/MetJ-type ribon-helix-helix transcriptional regulator
MSNLTKQILLKVSPELDDLIDQAFSKHLKKTGEYLTRSDYIRRILQKQCTTEMKEKV